MTEPREPELPFNDDLEAVDFTGPRDQVGFADLKPAQSHPLADYSDSDETSSSEPPAETGSGNGDGGGGDGPDGDPDHDDGTGDQENRMGLLDHLDELRTVLIHSFFAAVAATILCWF